MTPKHKELSLVVHIPHAGTTIPASERLTYTNLPAVDAELNRLTDWFTDELFAIDGAAVVSTPISRLLVDVERFIDDALEPKAAVGQGVIYELDSLGQRFRNRPTAAQRQQLLDTYYHPHHQRLESVIANQLTHSDKVLLIDGHSFPAVPLPNDDDQENARPDICIGTCSNTPDWLTAKVEQLCAISGWPTAINFPYDGCLVPTKYAGDQRVMAVMIEVNRALYLEQPEPALPPAKRADFVKVKKTLQRLVWELTSPR